MKTRSITMLSFVLLFSLAIIAYSNAASSEDVERAAVKQAVLDYVEGVYEVDPARIERSVHPDLAKRGFYVKKGESNYIASPMTFAELISLAKTYNKNGRIPKDAPKEIIVFDVLNQTASVKLVASWGVDYMHLAKYDGKWMIVNVLWQSPPKTRDP